MENTEAKPIARKGFLRRLFTWRKILFFAAALITLVILLLVEENWRGARAWRNYKREMEAKGERFDVARLIPPKVPDDQNLATLPFFTNSDADPGPITGRDKELSWPDLHRDASWRYGLAGDMTEWAKAFHDPREDTAQAASVVLAYLNKDEPVLAKLESVRQRPDCRFNIDYENWPNPAVVDSLFTQFTRCKRLIRLLSLRAQAEMVSGQTDQAVADIDLMFRIDGGLRDEPLLIAQLVWMANMSIILNPIGEGLAEHRWSDAQLKILQEHLQKTDFLAPMVNALYGERDICDNQALDHGRLGVEGWNKLPRGWLRLEQVNMNHAINDDLVPRINLAARQISPSQNHQMDLTSKYPPTVTFWATFVQHSIFARLGMSALARVPEKTAYAQSEVDMAGLGCALERFRLAEGHYPAELNELVPRFVAVLPHDIINGQPLKYRRTDDGRFILYSVGWNEKDDGGVVAVDENKHQDKSAGDWVWQYPAETVKNRP